MDGNERLAWLATAVLLALNCHAPALTDDEAFNLVMSVSTATIDLPEIAAALEPRVT